MVKHRHALGIIRPVVSVAQTIHIGIQTVVDVSLPHDLSELLGVEHLHLVRIRLYGHRTVEVHMYLTFLTSLGGDDDHTVGSTATVDRGRGSILQHLDTLDIITVELVHARLGRHTIYNIKRIVVVQGTDTTDTYGSGS